MALAAAAAGAYYFFGKDGKKHQAQASKWVKQAKTDVLKEVKRLKRISRPMYDKAVSQVIAEYKKIKSVDKQDLEKLSKELKGYYTGIAAKIKEATKAKTPKKQAVKKKK